MKIYTVTVSFEGNLNDEMEDEIEDKWYSLINKFNDMQNLIIQWERDYNLNRIIK